MAAELAAAGSQEFRRAVQATGAKQRLTGEGRAAWQPARGLEPVLPPLQETPPLGDPPTRFW